MLTANRQAPDGETPAAAAGAPAGPPEGTPAGTPAGTAAGVPADLAARPAARPKLRHKRYPLMNQLSAEQVRLFRTIANTYIPDMYDPAAVEVLLVVLEICHILDLTPGIVARIFGARVLAALETWGDLVPPRQRPDVVRRAWVWLPNQTRPGLYPIDGDGTIHVHEA